MRHLYVIAWLSLVYGSLAWTRIKPQIQGDVRWQVETLSGEPVAGPKHRRTLAVPEPQEFQTDAAWSEGLVKPFAKAHGQHTGAGDGAEDTRGAGGVERLWPDHGRRKDVAGIKPGRQFETFEGGAARKDVHTGSMVVLETQRPSIVQEVGIKPDRHLQAFEPVQSGKWETYIATGYATGCVMPRGPEHHHAHRMASGTYGEPNWSIAADPSIPFGSVLELSADGIVTTRIVHDRGRAIKGKRLDLFMSSCERARTFGVRRISVREVSRPLGGR